MLPVQLHTPSGLRATSYCCCCHTLHRSTCSLPHNSAETPCPACHFRRLYPNRHNTVSCYYPRCCQNRRLFSTAERLVVERTVQPRPQGTGFPCRGISCYVVRLCIQPILADNKCSLPIMIQNHPFNWCIVLSFLCLRVVSENNALSALRNLTLFFHFLHDSFI